MMPRCVVAVDPGRDKCGVAVLDSAGEVLWQQVVPAEELLTKVSELLLRYGCRTVVLGDQTYSAAAGRQLEPLREQGKLDEVILVDERGSTEQARTRYWQANPPSGWRRFLPLGLLVPPCAVDDFAAIILGERYFRKKM